MSLFQRVYALKINEREVLIVDVEAIPELPVLPHVNSAWLEHLAAARIHAAAAAASSKLAAATAAAAVALANKVVPPTGIEPARFREPKSRDSAIRR